MNSGTDPNAGRGHRLFYALWPPAAVREELATRTRRLANVARGRWVARENLHVTLWFVGAIDHASLQQRLQLPSLAENAFELELAVIRYRRRQNLLWIEPRAVPTTLLRLAAALPAFPSLAPAIGEQRPFAPHVTLARKVMVESALPESITPIVWPVDSYALVESVLQPSGPKYHVLQTWSLRSMPAAGSVK